MKRLFALMAFVFLGHLSQAQAALLALIFGDKIATEDFHISIDLGMNFSSMPGLEKQSSRNGFYYGLGSFIKINDKWALTPEVKLLSPRGANNVNPISIYSGLVPDATYDFNLGYIDVPVLAQYKLTPKVFASAGPQISFLTRARQIAETTLPTGQEVSVNEDISDKFNSLYFSVPLELGYSLHNARDGKGLNLKVRYNVGLTNMFANTDYGSSRGSTFQVFLSLPFVLPPDKE